MDVQFAPVALGERREGRFLTGDRGGDDLDFVGALHRHLSTSPHGTCALVPVMPPARVA